MKRRYKNVYLDFCIIFSWEFPRRPMWITEEYPERISTMEKYVTFHWFSCHCSGAETCLEENFEEQKKFFKAVFGAYHFEIIHN